MKKSSFVSRAGEKLLYALEYFKVDVSAKVAADLGCSTGGFTDCLLQRGAARVYAVDTGYGVLDWKLRSDPRVNVMERTNAMHVALPEAVDIVAIDVAWTRQQHIVPAAGRLLKQGGIILTLVKPQYESEKKGIRKGRVVPEALPAILKRVEAVFCEQFSFERVESPLRGAKGGNPEYFYCLKAKAGVDNLKHLSL